MKRFTLTWKFVISIALLTVTVALFAYANQTQGRFTPLDSAKISRSELLDNLFTQADGSACIGLTQPPKAVGDELYCRDDYSNTT
jgi:hypothetical protein